jgi:hypothetical protein
MQQLQCNKCTGNVLLTVQNYKSLHYEILGNFLKNAHHRATSFLFKYLEILEILKSRPQCLRNIVSYGNPNYYLVVLLIFLRNFQMFVTIHHSNQTTEFESPRPTWLLSKPQQIRPSTRAPDRTGACNSVENCTTRMDELSYLHVTIGLIQLPNI